MIFTGWATPLTLLQLELVQRDYEGHPVPEDLKEQVAALDDDKDAMNFEAVDTLYRALDKLPKDPTFAYVHPMSLKVFAMNARMVPGNSAALPRPISWTDFMAPGQGVPPAVPLANRLKAWASSVNGEWVDDRPSEPIWKTGSTGHWTTTSVAPTPVTTCG